MDRNSESESITNEDSSDTNMGNLLTNHEETGIKTTGKQSTTNSLSTNGTQNGMDRSSPMPEVVAAKQKNSAANTTKKAVKKARNR